MYAIALTLLAIELVLPAASENLHGEALLQSILDSWPKVLSFLTSFTLIAIFWQGNHRSLHYLRRFDGRLVWLTFLQLLCIAFIPFPTAIVGEHLSDPVAQEFYFGTILVTGLATLTLWWYVSSEPRLVDPGLHPRVVRRLYLNILVGPVAFSIVMMVLIAVGIGRLINPLLLGYHSNFATSYLGYSSYGSHMWSNSWREGARRMFPLGRSSERTPTIRTPERSAQGASSHTLVIFQEHPFFQAPQ